MMSELKEITSRQVDVSIPTRSIFHSKELSEAFIKNRQEIVAGLSQEIFPIGEHQIAIDEYGRLTVYSTDFTNKIREFIRLANKDVRAEDINLCGCKDGSCNIYKCNE
jgi:hypothetical protein